MPYENTRSITLSPVEASDIAQKRFVAIGANGEVDLSANAGNSVGTTAEASPVGSNVDIPVILLDGSKQEVEAGAAIAAGTRIMSNATGQAITATGATSRVLGVTLTTATAAGEIVTFVGQKDAGQFVA